MSHIVNCSAKAKQTTSGMRILDVFVNTVLRRKHLTCSKNKIQPCVTFALFRSPTPYILCLRLNLMRKCKKKFTLTGGFYLPSLDHFLFGDRLHKVADIPL